MGDILILVFTASLVLVSGFIVLIVLMQRPSANSGMGSALGGGAAESAFGAQTGNVLTRATIIGCVCFFVLAFSLYLGHMANLDTAEERSSKLSDMLTEDSKESKKLSDDSLTDLATILKEVEESTQAEDVAKAEEGKGELIEQLDTEPDVKTDEVPEEAPAVEKSETK